MRKIIIILSSLVILALLSSCSSKTINPVKPQEKSLTTSVKTEKNSLNSYETLDKLPREYNSKLAQEKGDVVYAIDKVYNPNKLADFFEALKRGKEELSSMVRITQFTTEGDAIINDLVIGDEGVKLIMDNTRDKYAGTGDRKITEYKVSDIVKEEKGEKICYTVKIDKNKGLFSFYINK